MTPVVFNLRTLLGCSDVSVVTYGKVYTFCTYSQRPIAVITGESGEGLCFDEVGEIVIVPGGGFESQSD